MKKFYWLLMMVFIASCDSNKNNEVFYQSYGVVKEDVNTSGKLYVKSDAGKAIIPSPDGWLSNDDKDSRVWMSFSTTDNVALDTIRGSVRSFLKITPMDFKTQNNDSISESDEVFLQEMWIAQDYLTLIMDATAGSEISLKDHTYTMYSNKEVVSDTVRMEFKYDRNNDSHNIKFSKIVALKLDDKITVNSDSTAVVLAVKYRTNAGLKEQYLKYAK
jgi:hypothetical protein